MSLDLNPERILPNFHKWLLKMATVYLPGQPNDWQDLAQEGYIAMWKALSKFDASKGALPTYLTWAAKRRMIECVKRDHWFGMPTRYGHDKGEGTELPFRMDNDDDELVQSFLDSDVTIAYHEGEILAAINALTPTQREYVYRRFWRDEAPKVINASIGNGWVGAKDKLKNRLGHLA